MSNDWPAGASDTSFWQAGAPSFVLPTELPSEVDVAVIGGGLLGACTAYWLARTGARPLVLERTGAAGGATGRNGGFHVVGTAEGYTDAIARLGHADARAVWQITLESRALLRQVLHDEQIDCEYREPGHLHLTLSASEYDHCAQSVAALHADGFAAELLDRAQVQRLIHTPLSPEITGALHGPENALLHPVRFIQGLLAAAMRHGARLVHVDARGLHAEGGGVRIDTSRGSVRAGAVVVALNAWSDELVPALRGIVTPVRGQVLAFDPLPHIFPLGMGAAVTPTGEYWQQTPSGAIVLGGCRAVAPGGEYGERTIGTTAIVQQALEQVLPHLFPQMDGLHVERRWGGLMAFTPDYLPVATPIPNLPNAWCTGGFCGHGMPFGMRVGQLLAEATSSPVPPIALSPLRLDRPTLRGMSV